MKLNAVARNAKKFSVPVLYVPTFLFAKPVDDLVIVSGADDSHFRSLAQFVRSVRRFASVRDLRLISIGYRNDWADQQWMDAGPLEFATLMQRAAVVAKLQSQQLTLQAAQAVFARVNQSTLFDLLS